MLRSIGKQSGESVAGVSPGEEMVGYGGKDLQKRKVLGLSLEWKSKGVMDDDSGESMELMEEVPLGTGRGRIGEISAWLTEGSWVDSRDEGKHTGRNDLLFVKKMMWMGERVWPKMKSECCEEAELWWAYADRRLGGCHNFVGKWEELVFNALSYL